MGDVQKIVKARIEGLEPDPLHEGRVRVVLSAPATDPNMAASFSLEFDQFYGRECEVIVKSEG